MIDKTYTDPGFAYSKPGLSETGLFGVTSIIDQPIAAKLWVKQLHDHDKTTNLQVTSMFYYAYSHTDIGRHNTYIEYAGAQT